ncbi:MAG: C_GCAxxG_C_C family protein [Spirochaetales bacterium]|nr:C_GCAxxG_C_C family protein [Spirochaetales bacterium]
MKKTDDALARFAAGADCCKAVAAVFNDDLELDDIQKMECMNLSTPLPGRPDELCGAVRAGLAVIRNLKKSKKDPEYATRLADVFREMFSARNNSIKCNELINCDINDPYVRMELMDKGTCDEVCRKYIADAVEILERLLGQE